MFTFVKALIVLALMASLPANANQSLGDKLSDKAGVRQSVRSGPIRVVVVFDQSQQALVVYEYFSVHGHLPFWLVARGEPLFSSWLKEIKIRTVDGDKIRDLKLNAGDIVVAAFDGWGEDVFAAFEEFNQGAVFAVNPRLPEALAPDYSQARSLLELAQSGRLLVDAGMLTRFSTGLSLYEGYFDSRVVAPGYETLQNLKSFMKQAGDYEKLLNDLLTVARGNIALLEGSQENSVASQFFHHEIQNAKGAIEWAKAELAQLGSDKCAELLSPKNRD